MNKERPIGPVPRYIWLKQRIGELCKAITNFSDFKLRLKWIKEIEECIELLNKKDDLKI